MSKPVFRVKKKKKKKNTSKCYLLRILYSVLRFQNFKLSKQVNYSVKILAFTKYKNAFENIKLSQLKLFYQKKKNKMK